MAGVLKDFGLQEEESNMDKVKRTAGTFGKSLKKRLWDNKTKDEKKEILAVTAALVAAAFGRRGKRKYEYSVGDVSSALLEVEIPRSSSMRGSGSSVAEFPSRTETPRNWQEYAPEKFGKALKRANRG